MHMFVPALPYAAHELGASTGQAQMTISLYIIGLAVGQLFYGPLSDAFGRRPMLMTGLALYTVAGLAAALAPGLHVLVGARLVQALGGCAGLALGRAIVRDTARSDKAVGQLALMNLMTMIGPGLAPMVGGAIAATLGWRAIFWLLTAFGAFTLAFTWRLLPETAPAGASFSARTLVNDYRGLLRSTTFVGYTFGGACTTTSMYAFVAAAPFIFATQLHRPLHEVGFYLGFLIFGLALGNASTARLIRRFPMERLLLGGNALTVLSAAALLLVTATGHLSVGAVLALMFLFTCGAGMASPAALTKSLSLNPKLVGSAAGLYGFTQMAVGAVCTSLAAVGNDQALTAAGVLTGAAVLGQAGFWLALRNERKQALVTAP
ncbi:MAG: Bcr/CflA family drug resistance efflux transporter [Ramlibacter sp.]|nr:Bcr/CflA family drug resistance efflux transporter [Ramlibacter sp.]